MKVGDTVIATPSSRPMDVGIFLKTAGGREGFMHHSDLVNGTPPGLVRVASLEPLIFVAARAPKPKQRLTSAMRDVGDAARRAGRSMRDFGRTFESSLEQQYVRMSDGRVIEMPPGWRLTSA